LAVAVFWVAGLSYASPLPPLKSYRVTIVSPPPAAVGPVQTEVTADPEPVRPEAREEPPREPETQPVVEPAPKAPEKAPEPKPEPPRAQPPEKKPPAPKPAEPKPADPKPEESKPPAPKPAPRPATGSQPKPDATQSGSGLNIRIEGDVFPFPGYLEQIAEQIGRYFRWTGEAGLKAEIYFEIMRDGSVQGIRLLSGSGNSAFNFEAMGAIEQAGNRRAFGALPEGYTGDRLPVSFYFEPAR
jgi:protein TonB